MTMTSRLITVAAIATVSVPILAQNPKARQGRPIPMGVSISNTPSLPFIYAGTAGMLVHPFSNPNLKLILSNNHVLGAKGPSLCPNSATPGTFTLQPGTLDIGNDPGANPFYLAGVFGAFRPLTTTSQNLIDAALAVTTTTLAKRDILGIGPPNAAVGIATPGMSVTKAGRTTGVTNGTVDSVNVSAVVSYGSGCPSYSFVGQTVITPAGFSAGGDSGSVILDSATHTPVGLLFAGNATSTLANQIYWVYVLLGVFPDGPAGTAVSSVEQVQSIRASKEAAMDPRIAQVSAVQARHENRLFAIPGIHAIGIGLDGGEMVLKVYGTNLTPEIAKALPQRLDGVRVVFRESGGEFKAR